MRGPVMHTESDNFESGGETDEALGGKDGLGECCGGRDFFLF